MAAESTGDPRMDEMNARLERVTALADIRTVLLDYMSEDQATHLAGLMAGAHAGDVISRDDDSSS